jgi:hypothetical protein
MHRFIIVKSKLMNFIFVNNSIMYIIVKYTEESLITRSLPDAEI